MPHHRGRWGTDEDQGSNDASDHDQRAVSRAARGGRGLPRPNAGPAPDALAPPAVRTFEHKRTELTAQESREQQDEPTGLVRFAWLLALAFGVAIAVLAFFRVEAVYSSPLLFTVLNIAFLSVISFVVSWVAARSYLRDGSKAVLLLGCGTLALGLGGLLAPLHIGGPGANSIATIYDTAALMAGACHLFSSVGRLSERSGRRPWDWRHLLAGYLTIVALVCALVILVRIGLWPTYFVEGSGATVYGHVVLYGANALFALSAVLLGLHLGRPKSSFRAWYSLGLGLIAIGLVGISLQLKMGDPLNWVGRSAQYLGCVCMLIAVVSTARSSGFWMLTVERALRASEERYRTILENMPIGFFQARAEGGLVYANPAHAKFLGYDSPAELAAAIDEDAGAVSHHAEPARHAAFVDQAIRADGEWRDFENRYRRKDGSYADALLYMSYRLDPDTGEYLAYGFVQDITERKLVEAALTHSHDLMRYIIEHDRSAIAVHDRDLKYVYVSQRYLHDYGVEEHDVIGKHHYDVFPDLPQKWRDVHQKALAGEISSAEDDSYVREDGTVVWTRWECRPWYEADGSIGGIIVYTEVITERKQVEEALARSVVQLREQLHDTVQAMGAITGLRDPLHGRPRAARHRPGHGHRRRAGARRRGARGARVRRRGARHRQDRRARRDPQQARDAHRDGVRPHQAALGGGTRAPRRHPLPSAGGRDRRSAPRAPGRLRLSRGAEGR